ncbi:MAG: PQQ-binding-like beta-propeller repeat protein [Burkholderiaceae bacterium]
MNTQPLPLSFPSLRMRAVTTGLLLASLLGLAACSSSGPKPAKLESFTPTLDLKAKWTVSIDRLPAVSMGQGAFAPAVSSGLVVVAGPKGQVSGFKLQNGAQVFEQNLKTELAAGVGAGAGLGSGLFAVVTSGGELVLIDAKGAVRWRVAMGGVSNERPVIAGGSVLVRLADNRVAAFSQETGARRWVIQRTLPSLVLHGQSGMKTAADVAIEPGSDQLGAVDLVVGLPGARLLWLNATNGAVRWETTVVTPRGSNEVERLSDLLGEAAVVSDLVCVAAYQNQISCHEVGTGRAKWTQRLDVSQPVAADQTLVIGVEANSRVHAYDRATGEKRWSQLGLFLRGATEAVSFDRAIWIADQDGYLHGLSRDSGQFIARVSLPGGKPAGRMLVTREGLLIQTQSGRLMLMSASAVAK